MSKSFCTGCKYWEWLPDDTWTASGYKVRRGFHYCAKFNGEDLNSRKVLCGGRKKQVKQSEKP